MLPNPFLLMKAPMPNPLNPISLNPRLLNSKPYIPKPLNPKPHIPRKEDVRKILEMSEQMKYLGL